MQANYEWAKKLCPSARKQACSELPRVHGRNPSASPCYACSHSSGCASHASRNHAKEEAESGPDVWRRRGASAARLRYVLPPSTRGPYCEPKPIAEYAANHHVEP